MQNEYTRVVKPGRSGGVTYHSNKVEEMYPDAYFMSIEREQRQERSKIVRQIMRDDYMKKYGRGTP